MMSVRIHNVPLAIEEPETLLAARAAERLGLPPDAVRGLRIARRAIDARRGRVRFIYSVDLEFADVGAEAQALRAGAVPAELPPPSVTGPGSENIRGRVVVVGCGPAGLFAALVLAGRGYCPLLIERGGPVGERHARVKEFHSSRRLDPETNLLFGAGGAGAYSDGKLRTRIRDQRVSSILEELIACGAPETIGIDARPHVGTDLLHGIVERLCAVLIERGGEIAWHTRMTGIEVTDGALQAAETTQGRVETNCLLLAGGANARDTFAALAGSGVATEGKPFQMGVRIEHPRELIDRAVYGRSAGHERLGAAEYVLSAQGVTAFCVCPGGTLVAASAVPGTVCTNGMSTSARDADFTNSGLVTTVSPDEFGGGPLDGLAYQEHWERNAFELAGGDYTAPAQNVRDFLAGECTQVLRETTYPFGVRPLMMNKVLPASVAKAISLALPEFEKRISGFAGDTGVLIGPETRASCPVRIVRDPARRVSATVEGLYPAGEGSGYSSGIMSSAVDGIKSAEAVIARFSVPRLKQA